MKTKLIKNNDTLKFTPYQLAKLEDLLTNGKSFIDSDKFKDKEFCNKLMIYKGPEVDTQWFFNHINSLDGLNNDAYAKSTTLSSNEEELLFLKYNYLKKTINSISTLNVESSYDRILDLDDEVFHVRDQLVSCNLGLVLNIARNNKFNYVDFYESLSEGHVVLIDCVEKFNTEVGKFSTYFTRSFVNALIKKNTYNIKYSSNLVDYDEVSHDVPEDDHDSSDYLELMSSFLSGDNNLLDKDELFVLRKKYIDGLTLEEVGKFFDPIKTKGQVFYIEKRARLKIKDYMTDMI